MFLVMSLASSPQQTFYPYCSSDFSLLDSLNGPWTWFILCLDWDCWWTLLLAPAFCIQVLRHWALAQLFSPAWAGPLLLWVTSPRSSLSSLWPDMDCQLQLAWRHETTAALDPSASCVPAVIRLWSSLLLWPRFANTVRFCYLPLIAEKATSNSTSKGHILAS